jgi:FtsP/CotA-like multicopper oxidase with cupredoxin domain
MKSAALYLAVAIVLGACQARLAEVEANDNRKAAGVISGDTLDVRLVVQEARWHPEAADGPSLVVAAIAEENGPPQIPPPLLRVKTGTVISASVRNALRDSTVWMYGLFTRPAAEVDSFPLAPGETRTVTFVAGAPGTYLYAAQEGVPDPDVLERELMVGAFVIDSIGARTDDRILVMNIWGDPVDSTGYRNALAINGKSYPHNETIAATTGDTVRWRIVNGTIRPHPMHLHGFYFDVLSRGKMRIDSLYTADQRRAAVTEVMDPFSTMAVSWIPDRDGRWLFHCHIAFHAVAEGARLDGHGSHAMLSEDPGEHMAGLVLGIDVKAGPGWTPERREDVRTLRLLVREGARLGRADRTLGYAIEHGDLTPTEPLTRAGGPVLVLTRGQPTDITVINTLKEHTAVHWHGLELESYSDGVTGWSGHAGKAAPRIAPSDSFVARLSMPRAGTFIYHTHLNDLAQLTGGLYGAIIVTEPRAPFDPETDHVFVNGWDGPDEPPQLLINGDSVLAPMHWRAGRRHRIRVVNIGPAGMVKIMLRRDSTTMSWVPLAKDGADLASHRQVPGPAVQFLDVGETADFAFTPPARGEYELSIGGEKQPRRQRIIVR